MNTTTCAAWMARGRGRSRQSLTVYQVTDRLHEGRCVQVTGHQIAPTVSTWLAELGVESPMAVDLAQAVCAGDWPVAHELARHLCVHVSVAAQPRQVRDATIERFGTSSSHRRRPYGHSRGNNGPMNLSAGVRSV